ncbi:hypothetical protein LguiA_029078 [Lonicera macranthoides]
MCNSSFGQIRYAEFSIVTLGQDFYRRNLDSVPKKLDFTTGFGVCYVDDVIFCSGWVDSTKVVVMFEVGPEKFRVLMLPNGVRASAANSDIIQVKGCLGFLNVTYAKAGEVDVNPLMNVMVVEILGYVKVSDFNHDYDDNEVEEVQVMTIWILEDYHK